jgi:hypothetical protein
MCHPVLYNFVVVVNIFLHHGATLICNDWVHPPSSPSVGKLYRNREGWSRFARGKRVGGPKSYDSKETLVLFILSSLYGHTLVTPITARMEISTENHATSQSVVNRRHTGFMRCFLASTFIFR